MKLEHCPEQQLAGRRFGRAEVPVAIDQSASTLASDLRLFGMTFAAGFLFVSLYLA